jgi:hypothetical protein
LATTHTTAPETVPDKRRVGMSGASRAPRSRSRWRVGSDRFPPGSSAPRDTRV